MHTSNLLLPFLSCSLFKLQGETLVIYKGMILIFTFPAVNKGFLLALQPLYKLLPTAWLLRDVGGKKNKNIVTVKNIWVTTLFEILPSTFIKKKKKKSTFFKAHVCCDETSAVVQVLLLLLLLF